MQALSRLGRTPEDQARWLLRLAHTRGTGMTDRDWLARQAEIGAFLFLDPTDNLFFGHGVRKPVPREAAEACIAALRAGLQDLVTEGKWVVEHPRINRVAEWWTHTPFRWRTTLPFISEPTDEETRRRGWGFYSRKVDWRGYFMLRVYDVLHAVERRFRVCSNCRRAFIAHKRQAYCTSACSQSVRTREYRARHRARVNEQRRLAYERAVKKTLGKNVQVSKRRQN